MAADTTVRALTAAVVARHSEIQHALVGLGHQQLREQSRLPGWDRLTIVCHLRYGASASRRMTTDALDGRPTAFYPLGRAAQRPSSLQPQPGESPSEVVTSLGEESRRVDNLWHSIEEHQWQQTIDEPEGNPDLGSITLWTLLLLRFTEVEVHGYDLDLDLSPWSETFVSVALPMRLKWLPTRRSNHRALSRPVDRSWALISTDGPSFLIQAKGDAVEVSETSDEPSADAAIIGQSHQLLSYILGRSSLDSLTTRGDHNLAASFSTAFPPP